MLYASSFIPLFFFFYINSRTIRILFVPWITPRGIMSTIYWQQSVEFPEAFSDTNPEQV
jgi:hypothetical protein